MFYIRKYSAVTPSFGVWNEGFTSDEVDKILFLEKTLTFGSGQVGMEQKIDKNARNSKVCFLAVDSNTDWIWNRLGQIVPKANYDLFLRDISAIEAIQYTIYKHKDQQFYDWHTDTHGEYNELERKISLVVSLSDPDEYEGGDLEIINNGNPENSLKLRPSKGDIVFFDSKFPHKVHPVTKGTRKTLVSWVLGKRES